MKLRRVEKWTKGKPQFPALVSAVLVVQADMIFGALKGQAYHEGYANLFSVHDIEEWSKLYERLLDEPTIERVIELFSDVPIVHGFTALKEELMQVRELNDLNRPGITNWIRTHFLEDFNIEPDESTEDERLREITPIFELPFIVFTFRVFLPCMIYYQSPAASLLKQAMCGDIESLRRLLRVDKNLLAIPEIRAVWDRVSRHPESADFKALSRAMATSPHKSLKASRVKTATAAGIDCLFKFMGTPIRRPEIQKLFDAYAYDTEGVPRDVDLPEAPDSFDKAIRREIENWKADFETHQRITGS
jgi:hypothetical protein